MKSLLACAAIIVAAGAAHAQGVGINTTGAPADTSAILDLSSTTRGLLLPRLTTAQRAAIVLPATGLVIYQTDGTPGMYWNAGTPAAPSWKLVSEAGAGGGSSQWSTSGSNIYFSAGRVAVGTTPNQFRFAVQDTGTVFRVQSNNTTGLMASFGGFGQVQVDAPGIAGGRLALLGNGNLGLGVVNPTNKLSFAPLLGKKISLYPGATGDVGFGVAGNRLQIYSDNPNADVAIGYDAAGVFNERFAVKPNGALAVVGNTGAAGQVLQSNGGGAAATWVAPTHAAYNDIQIATSTNITIVPSGTTVALPGLALTFSTAGNARVIVNTNVFCYNLECALCPGSEGRVNVLLDGVAVRQYIRNLGNGDGESIAGTTILNVAAGDHTISISGQAIGKEMNFGHSTATLSSQLSVQVVKE